MAAQYGRKGLEMPGNGWKWLEWPDICMEIAENGWKWLELADNTVKWQK